MKDVSLAIGPHFKHNTTHYTAHITGPATALHFTSAVDLAKQLACTIHAAAVSGESTDSAAELYCSLA